MYSIFKIDKEDDFIAEIQSTDNKSIIIQPPLIYFHEFDELIESVDELEKLNSAITIPVKNMIYDQKRFPPGNLNKLILILKNDFEIYTAIRNKKLVEIAKLREELNILDRMKNGNIFDTELSFFAKGDSYNLLQSLYFISNKEIKEIKNLLENFLNSALHIIKRENEFTLYEIIVCRSQYESIKEYLQKNNCTVKESQYSYDQLINKLVEKKELLKILENNYKIYEKTTEDELQIIKYHIVIILLTVKALLLFGIKKFLIVWSEKVIKTDRNIIL